MLQTAESRRVEARRKPAAPIVLIVIVSVLILGLLSWLLYLHHASPGLADRLTFLPPLEALLNGLAAVSLVAGFLFIRRHKVRAHRNSMAAAFLFSILFFVVYTINHAIHGDLYFQGSGAMKTAYLSILASHIALSAVALPLALVTFYFALSGRFRRHRSIARYTLPIWLYVSVTGVVVYLMLGYFH